MSYSDGAMVVWILIMTLLPLLMVFVVLGVMAIVAGVMASKPGQGVTPQGVPPELLEEQSIAACIILSIVTGGIYTIIWQVRLCRQIRLLAREDIRCTGEVLCLVFVPFYMYYWLYTRGDKQQRILAESYGVRCTVGNSAGLIYLLLAFFGVGIVSFALMQNDMNALARRLKGQG